MDGCADRVERDGDSDEMPPVSARLGRLLRVNYVETPGVSFE